jgi:hypothetical protein
MKEVIFTVKFLLIMALLSSCSTGHQYITIVNRSVKPIEVSYSLTETKDGIINYSPKMVDADTTELDSKKFEPLKNFNPSNVEIKVLLPSGKVLIMGEFGKKDLVGDPVMMNFKGQKFNLTSIKIASDAGKVAKEESESKSIFQYDQYGNYRVLILD